MKLIEWKGELKCPECGCKPIWKNGIYVRGDIIKQKYKCCVCGHFFMAKTPKPVTRKQSSKCVKEVKLTYTFKNTRINWKKQYHEMFQRHIRYSHTFTKYINELDTIANLDIPDEYKTILILVKIEQCRQDENFD